MADRRCFHKSIITSDAFLDMPASARCLYFSLNIVADDDGFVNSPRSIMRLAGATEDDLKILIIKKFVICFEDGILVIKHWRIHNTIQKDRYTPTKYLEHLSELYLDENKAYTQDVSKMDTGCIQNGYKMETQFNLIKDKLIKDNIKENNIKENEADATASPPPKVKHKYGKYKNVSLTDEEHEKLLAEKNGDKAIEFLSEYREYKGYKAKSDYLAIKKWVFDALKENQQKKDKINGNHKRDYSEREYTQEELDGITTNIAEFDLEEL